MWVPAKSFGLEEGGPSGIEPELHFAPCPRHGVPCVSPSGDGVQAHLGTRGQQLLWCLSYRLFFAVHFIYIVESILCMKFCFVLSPI